ncbi:hypothetical protein [Pseudothermotoga thermarum]|uniref:Uncharacterized protein n=1 Tax=Pseudothermotoga thermarum DSM 5069 TaxID=688269 RepID=F7YXZ4_9THEM|nr:hypothetical protein [Pseudothermotoga thermarum]AEH50793.1 hypothetical protein Theth_0708 [Pseudothermotoga thermarum DSM 5069]
MIGYISTKKIDEKYVGGLLIVDQAGIPLEFKYTEPVIPTQLQKILYGKSLETYLYVEVIGKNLLKKAENKCEFYFTDTPILVDCAENVFFITYHPSIVEEVQKISAEECVIPAQSGSIKVSAAKEIKQETLEKLVKMLEEIDVMEPFQRLQKALEYVCRSSAG